MKSLTEIIYNYSDKKFNWGKLDCSIFVTECIKEYTGKDLPHMQKIKKYNNKIGAMRELRNLGCKSLPEAPEIILGNPKIPMSKVKLGYVVYYVNEEGEGILGICNGAQSYFLNREGGLVTRRTEDCLYCWSID